MKEIFQIAGIVLAMCLMACGIAVAENAVDSGDAGTCHCVCVVAPSSVACHNVECPADAGPPSPPTCDRVGH